VSLSIKDSANLKYIADDVRRIADALEEMNRLKKQEVDRQQDSSISYYHGLPIVVDSSLPPNTIRIVQGRKP
jgi:hypothetical protein